MTDAQTPATSPALPAAPENVGRGALVALAAVPAAIVLYAIVGGVFGGFFGLAALVVPPVAVWLYEKGAGAPLSRRGWLPIIGITVVALVLGILAGFVGVAYASYTAVGGKELFGSAFWTTVRLQMSSPDALLPILLGLGFGAVALIGLLRRPRPGAVAPQEQAPQQQTPPPAPPQA
ncbi:hypothetical protein [Schumannella luteola]